MTYIWEFRLDFSTLQISFLVWNMSVFEVLLESQLEHSWRKLLWLLLRDRIAGKDLQFDRISRNGQRYRGKTLVRAVYGWCSADTFFRAAVCQLIKKRKDHNAQKFIEPHFSLYWFMSIVTHSNWSNVFFSDNNWCFHIMEIGVCSFTNHTNKLF